MIFRRLITSKLRYDFISKTQYQKKEENYVNLRSCSGKGWNYLGYIRLAVLNSLKPHNNAILPRIFVASWFKTATSTASCSKSHSASSTTCSTGIFHSLPEGDGFTEGMNDSDKVRSVELDTIPLVVQNV